MKPATPSCLNAVTIAARSSRTDGIIMTGRQRSRCARQRVGRDRRGHPDHQTTTSYLWTVLEDKPAKAAGGPGNLNLRELAEGYPRSVRRKQRRKLVKARLAESALQRQRRPAACGISDSLSNAPGHSGRTTIKATWTMSEACSCWREALASALPQSILRPKSLTEAGKKGNAVAIPGALARACTLRRSGEVRRPASNGACDRGKAGRLTLRSARGATCSGASTNNRDS